MREHSRSITIGSMAASARKHPGSVRKADAIVSASRLSSFKVNRSRKRSICLGLIALNWRSISASTTGPCGTSMAIWSWRLGRATRRHPSRHLAQTVAAVLEGLADPGARIIRQHNVMALTSPVDACIPLAVIGRFHSFWCTSATLADSCTRSDCSPQIRRGLPTGLGRGQSAGAHVLPRWSSHRRQDRLGSGSITPPQAVARWSRFVPRFTARDQRRHAFQEPRENGTGVRAAPSGRSAL